MHHHQCYYEQLEAYIHAIVTFILSMTSKLPVLINLTYTQSQLFLNVYIFTDIHVLTF